MDMDTNTLMKTDMGPVGLSDIGLINKKTIGGPVLPSVTNNKSRKIGVSGHCRNALIRPD